MKFESQEGSLPLRPTEKIQRQFFEGQLKFISFVGLFTWREILRFTNYKNYIFIDKYYFFPFL